MIEKFWTNLTNHELFSKAENKDLQNYGIHLLIGEIYELDNALVKHIFQPSMAVFVLKEFIINEDRED